MLFQYNAYAILTIKNTAAFNCFAAFINFVFYDTNGEGKMAPAIKRYLKITALLMMSACLTSGCAAKENADTAYSNQRYSYDEEEIFSCDSWTR